MLSIEINEILYDFSSTLILCGSRFLIVDVIKKVVRKIYDISFFYSIHFLY